MHYHFARMSLELEVRKGMCKANSDYTHTSLDGPVWLWEWLRLEGGDAWLLSRYQAAFRGLVLTTLQMRTACKQIT